MVIGFAFSSLSPSHPRREMVIPSFKAFLRLVLGSWMQEFSLPTSNLDRFITQDPEAGEVGCESASTEALPWSLCTSSGPGTMVSETTCSSLQ